MSIPLKDNDPCQFMLYDEFTTTPVFHKKGCYICEDPEFSEMGLPLCFPCESCKGHVAADSTTCDDCGKDQQELWEQKQHDMEINNDRSRRISRPETKS